MPPSSVILSSGPSEQSSPPAKSTASRSAMASPGTPSSELLLSTTPRHPPSPQRSRAWPPTEMDRMATCQKPCSGCTTADQARSEARRASLWPPKVISARPSWWPGGTKMAKCGSSPADAVSRPKKLYSPLTERPERPRPTMPSKGACANGSAVMFVAATRTISAQASAREPAPRSAPRQTRSRTKLPVTLPGSTSLLSRPMDTTSPRAPFCTGCPSAFTLTAPSASAEYRRCFRQAGAEQRVESRITWPEPVSKKTSSSWGPSWELPTLTVPM
mmetsp:Transcript_16015/g.45790  ORF Transcript_16015/g.45790 Transcript_16015/m.45790 type:complete len:274 (-) Transcript_16015:251-1072(-)